MKVILINGSPHEKGCTNRALEEVKSQLIKEGVEAEIFWIGTKVQGCIGCYSCKKTGKCVFDDGVSLFLEKAKDADGFVFGSPVYYAGPCAGLCAFMERAFFSGGRFLADKPAATIVSCRRGGASEAFARLNMFYTFNNMPMISSQYWNQVHGSAPEQVEQDLEGLQTMRTLAVNMAWLLKCIEAGKKSGIPLPEREKRVSTSFIR